MTDTPDATSPQAGINAEWLYLAFWKRNGWLEPIAFADQADAIRKMWIGIAKDALVAPTPIETPNGKLIEALIACADKFSEYAALHAAKPDPEKSRRNMEMADMCLTAVAHYCAPISVESSRSSGRKLNDHIGHALRRVTEEAQQ